MKYFIDTNIFLRIIVKDDEIKQKDCVKLLGMIKKGTFDGVTSSVVLAEIVWTLQSYYKLSKKDVIAIAKGILNLHGLEIIDRYDYERALFLYETYSVKFIDSLIASNEQISTKKWTVVSYDKDFDKLGILRKEPAQLNKANS